MNRYMVGAYWQGRPATLRGYAQASAQFLRQLQRLHPAFQALDWVGERPNGAVAIAPSLANLGELIYAHAGDVADIDNADGTPNWDTPSEDGFCMWYSNGKSAAAGGISIAIHDGQQSLQGDHVPLPNSVVITFPESACASFPHPELCDAAFLARLLALCVACWRPDEALVTACSFAEAMAGDAIPGAGWLTYLRNGDAVAVLDDDRFASVYVNDHPAGGVILALGPALTLPPDSGQVALGRLLRDTLISQRMLLV